MDGVLLSVLVPVYNVEKYLEKSLGALLNQSYRNLEIILVDDGSTDSSGKICDEYAARDSRIQVVHKANGGLVSAREAGIQCATGKYIAFYDSDDYIEPDMYEEGIRFCEQNNLDVCALGYVKEYSFDTINDFQVGSPLVMGRDEALSHMLRRKHYGWELADKIFLRSKVMDSSIPHNIVCGEDLMRNWKIFAKVDRVGYLPLYKYHYIQRAGSESKSLFSEKQLTLLHVFDSIDLEIPSMASNVRSAYILTKAIYYVTILKTIVMIDFQDYRERVPEMQHIIRSNLRRIICTDSASKYQKLGAVFFLMPYYLCKKAVRLIEYYTSYRRRQYLSDKM